VPGIAVSDFRDALIGEGIQRRLRFIQQIKTLLEAMVEQRQERFSVRLRMQRFATVGGEIGDASRSDRQSTLSG
jgi:hypothetical protein